MRTCVQGYKLNLIWGSATFIYNRWVGSSQRCSVLYAPSGAAAVAVVMFTILPTCCCCCCSVLPRRQPYQIIFPVSSEIFTHYILEIISSASHLTRSLLPPLMYACRIILSHLAGPLLCHGSIKRCTKPRPHSRPLRLHNQVGSEYVFDKIYVGLCAVLVDDTNGIESNRE